MPQRRPAVKIKSELCLPVSVIPGLHHFKVIKEGHIPVFLGLGPDPGLIKQIFPGIKRCHFLECPEFEAQMDASWREKIPRACTRITPDQLDSGELESICLIAYLPGLKYFPGFWSNVLARVRLTRRALNRKPDKQAGILVFGNERSLLVPELCWEIQEMGLSPILVQPAVSPEKLSLILENNRPGLAISINLQGMDPLGENFALFQRLDIAVALWMVDNPFHLLTSIKGKFWTRAHVFVTDHWFVNPLKDLGAPNVHHLPLAAGPGFFRSTGKKDPGLKHRAVYIGRSSFPGSRSFFAAARTHPELENLALPLMQEGFRPDFSWWSQNIRAPLWPGNIVREIGFGAHRMSLAWKKMFMESFSGSNELLVFGDRGWKDILPEWVEVRPEIDYYGPLASIYSSAGCVLNLTNMHLPYGLTQRHFDVWAAGGCLVTDKTPGLDIFPPELSEKISFSTPEEMHRLISRLKNDYQQKAGLKSDFRSLIQEKHTYRQRLNTIISSIGLDNLPLNKPARQ